MRGLVAGVRIIEEAIFEQEGMAEDIQNRMDEDGVHFDLDMYDNIEESIDDDEMDPDGESRAAMRATMEGLLAEAADQRAMVEAVAGVLECRSVLSELERARLECRSVRLDLERSRMDAEDLRSRQLRA